MATVQLFTETHRAACLDGCSAEDVDYYADAQELMQRVPDFWTWAN